MTFPASHGLSGHGAPPIGWISMHICARQASAGKEAAYELPPSPEELSAMRYTSFQECVN